MSETGRPVGITKTRPSLRLAVLACAFSLSLCFLTGWEGSSARLDFWGYHTPASVWLAGGDPYDPRQIAAAPDISEDEAHNPTLPTALVIMAPISLLPIDAAARVMWLISFLSLLAALVAMRQLWARSWPLPEYLIVAAVIAQSRLIQSVAYRGQPSLLVLAMVLFALLAARRGRAALAGAALALASLKFTLALPLAALWLWTRQWRVLAWAAVFGAALTAPAFVTLGGFDLVGAWLANVAAASEWNATHPSDWHLTTFEAVAGDRSWPVVGVLLAVAGVLASVWALRRAPSAGTDGWRLAILTSLGLVLVYHRAYDAVFLFPTAILAWGLVRRGPPAARPAALALSALLALVLLPLSSQSVALSTSEWLASQPLLAWLAPIGAWCALGVLVLSLVAAASANGVDEPVADGAR